MRLKDNNENLKDLIVLDLLNKKILIRGDEGTVLTLKCSTLNEFFDLKEKCSELLQSKNYHFR